jgi:hypothetical protein
LYNIYHTGLNYPVLAFSQAQGVINLSVSQILLIQKEAIMANFLLLYSGGDMPASEAEQKAVVQEWMNWFGTLGSDLVDGGNPFTPVAKSISSDGKVSNGPIGGMASG